MPGSLSDTSGGGGGFDSPIASAKPTISRLGGGFGGGGPPATEINDVPAASKPPPLAKPGHMQAGTVRSVPPVPGTQTQALNLDHTSLYLPRADGSQKVYENAYNADVNLMNVWRQSLGR